MQGLSFRSIFLGSFFFLVLLGYPKTLFAQEIPKEESSQVTESNTSVLVLSRERALDLALQNNRDLQRSELDFRLSKHKAWSAWNVLSPSVNLTAGVVYNEYNQQLGSGIPGFTPSPGQNWNALLGLSAQLNLSMASLFSFYGSILEYKNGRLSWEEAAASARRSAEKTFNSVLMLQKTLKLSELRLENSLNHYQQAQSNYSNGYASELDLLRAQVDYESTKPSLESDRSSYQAALMNLKVMLGLNPLRELVLEGEIEPHMQEVDVDDIVSRVGQRYDIQSLRHSLSMLSNVRSLQYSLLLPAFSVSYETQKTVNDPFGGNNWGSSEYIDTWRFVLAWNVNRLFPWDSNFISTRESSIRLRQQELLFENSLGFAQAEMYQLARNIKQYQDSLSSGRLALTLARRAYDLTLEAYGSGAVDFLTVRDASLAVVQAELALFSTQLNYANALVDLEFYTGEEYTQ